MFWQIGIVFTCHIFLSIGFIFIIFRKLILEK